MAATTVPSRWPAAAHERTHAPVRNPLVDAPLTLGARVADRVATAVGSWPFIIVQSALPAVWIVANIWLAIEAHRHALTAEPRDPYPLLLLSLMFSFQAVFTGRAMMSQNRRAPKGRLTAENDYPVNRVAEHALRVIPEHLVCPDDLMLRARSLVEAGRPESQDMRRVRDSLANGDRKILESFGQLS